MAYDGTLKFDTVIDTEGFDKGLEGIDKLSETIEKSIKKLSTAIRKSIGDFKDLGKNTNEVKDTFKESSNEMKKAEERVVLLATSTDDLKKIQDQVAEKTQKLSRQTVLLATSTENLKKIQDDAAKKSKKLAEEVEDVGDAAGKTSQETDKAKISLKDFGDKVEGAGKGLAVLTAGITAMFVGLVANTAVTKEYREEMGKLETAFTTAGHTANEASSTYESLFGIIGESDRAVETANHLAKLATTQENLTDWTTILTGVFATFGDSLPIESLAEAANETAKTGEVAGALADALNWAGVSEDEFKAKLQGVSTEQERQKLITETLMGIYSGAAEKYREVNEEVIRANEIQSSFNESLAKLGEVMQPIINDFLEAFAAGFEKLVDWVSQLDEGTIKIILGFTGLIAVVSPLLILVGSLAGAISNVTGLIALFAPVAVTATAATAGAGVAATTTAGGVGLLSAAFAFITGPIGLAVLAIAGIVIAITGLWKHSEAFRDFWLGVWEKIQAAPKKVMEDIKADLVQWKEIGTKIITGIFNGIKSGWQAIESWINDKFGWLDKKLNDWGLGGGGTKAQDASRGTKRNTQAVSDVNLRARVSGTYATGLANITRDMNVTVHRGEEIVSANKANADTQLLQQMVAQLDRLTRTVYNQPYVQRNILRTEGK